MCSIRRLKPVLRAAKPNFSPYVQNTLSDRGKIYIFTNSSPRDILRAFFQIFLFFAIARPG